MSTVPPLPPHLWGRDNVSAHNGSGNRAVVHGGIDDTHRPGV